jgi:hypothetical protein
MKAGIGGHLDTFTVVLLFAADALALGVAVLHRLSTNENAGRTRAYSPDPTGV